ncbi:MAG: RsmE family RNA methyltransferase [Leptospiraceae bacterium]|nr:RsmE family RNA methyltransferase [Leptospiraceae bacterium]
MSQLRYPIFFRKNETFSGELTLTREEQTHLKSLRLNDKEKILEFRNGQGSSAFFRFLENNQKGQKIEEISHNVEEPNISIAVAYAKSHALDLILQKGTEIGVSEFIFVEFHHSERKELNPVRAEKIFLQACSQSRRHSIPTLKTYSSLKSLIKSEKNLLYLHPYSKTKFNKPTEQIIPIIGPEAGFSDSELSLLEENQVSGFTLGNNILRIETAFLSVATILNL